MFSLFKEYKIKKGNAHPLGATPNKDGVNFSLFSEHATAVELLLFKKINDDKPFKIINLEPNIHKTFNFWHIYIKGLKPGIYYAYRVDGPNDLYNGHRFNKNKILIDPYAKAITDNLWDCAKACDNEDNIKNSMRGMVVDISNYDWEGDLPLKQPLNETIIYEMHVRGFTKSPTANCKYPGTFTGIIEKIPYLKELGITAVELLPVFYFDNKTILRTAPDGRALRNYWGYDPIAYFSPESSYCVNSEKGHHITEFRDMVKALHKAGIEVILDVVFNHTGEGDHIGPVINFKGIDNSVYYYLNPKNKELYRDYSGCGNSLQCNHPMVGHLVKDCLEFWVNEMHVDGFRFDQGSILSRGEDGKPMKYPPLLWNIELSRILADTKIITEAWDASGLYQVGYFTGYRWSEWNGLFRDDLRRFVKGQCGVVGAIAKRIAGSSDLYQKSGHLPINSINFITCHDGFTLKDLVSYNKKNNHTNGQNNIDGFDDNLSWNCGAEGETNDLKIEELRIRQIKNFITILMLSRGVPMILAGDELGRTQKGNNNGYCQDNEISWLDWNLLEQNKDIFRFFKLMIAFRRNNPVLQQENFFTGTQKNKRGLKDISWHGCKLFNPGWDDRKSRILSFTIGGEKNQRDIHVILNMENTDLNFEVPLVKGWHWYEIINTSRKTPFDIIKLGEEKIIADKIFRAKNHSAIVLISK
ncbi:MAG: glycogen debranching protein GlgX [bacterium]